MAIKLSRVERWILSNQYRILEKVEPENATFFAEIREVLENGWELEYDWKIDDIYRDDNCLSAEQCSEVLEVLSMFDQLHYSYEAISDKDKDGIDTVWLKFHGFDGNNESTLLGYCEHVFEDGRFAPVKPTGRDGTNSHMPTLDIYRRMMAAWRPLSKKRRDLSKSDIITILNEAPHAESEIGKLRDADVPGRLQ